MFDMDGTIADTLPLCVAAFQEAIRPILGRSVSEREILATFGPSEEGTIRAFIPDRFDEGLEAFFTQYRKLHEAMCPRPFEGMTEILEFLKSRGVIVALITGKGAKSLAITLDVLGMKDAFDAVETGVPTGLNKPRGMRNVLKTFGIDAQKAVYIGDSPTDVDASKETGIPVIAAAWAKTTDLEAVQMRGPDMICHSIAELDAYLRTRVS